MKTERHRRKGLKVEIGFEKVLKAMFGAVYKITP